MEKEISWFASPQKVGFSHPFHTWTNIFPGFIIIYSVLTARWHYKNTIDTDLRQ